MLAVTVSDGFGGTATAALAVTVNLPKFKATASKKKFQLNFKTGSDTLSVTLSSASFNAAVPDGTAIALVLGDLAVAVPTVLDSGTLTKNKATGAKLFGKFTYNAKAGSVTYTLSKSSLQSALAAFGAKQTPASGTLTIPLYIFIQSQYYGDDFIFSYSVSKAGIGKGF